MKKTIRYMILFVIVIIVLAIIGAAIYNSYYDKDRIQSCEVDSDCVLVEGGFTCCSCNTAINKEFVARFNTMPGPYCDGLMCKPCMAHNSAICEAGKCQAVYDPLLNT